MPVHFHDTLQASLREVRTDQESSQWLHDAYIRLVSRSVKNFNIGTTLRSAISEMQLKNASPYDLYGDPDDWADKTARTLGYTGDRAFDRQPDNFYLPIFWGLMIAASLTFLLAIRDTAVGLNRASLGWMLTPLIVGVLTSASYITYTAVLRRKGFSFAALTAIPSMLVVYLHGSLMLAPESWLARPVVTSWHAIGIFIYFCLAGLVLWRRNDLQEQEYDLDFIISPEEWEEEFIGTLNERGSLGDKAVKEALAQVHQSVKDKAEEAIYLWGNPVSYGRALNRDPSLPMRRHAILLGTLTVFLGVYAFTTYQRVHGLTGHQAWAPFLVAFFLFAVILLLTTYRAVRWSKTRRENAVLDLKDSEYFF